MTDSMNGRVRRESGRSLTPEIVPRGSGRRGAAARHARIRIRRELHE
jgi:hypothetical protein